LSKRRAKLRQVWGSQRQNAERSPFALISAAATCGTPVVVEAQGDWPKGGSNSSCLPPGGLTDPVARFIQSRHGERAADRGRECWRLPARDPRRDRGKSPPDASLAARCSHILISPFAGNTPPYKDPRSLLLLVGAGTALSPATLTGPTRTSPDAVHARRAGERRVLTAASRAAAGSPTCKELRSTST
jgi:hypothetical protein